MATRPGRPRSEEARRAVLRAAVREVERDGYGALTIEGIARAAGVSKQTVYRWWRSKAEIVLEALNEAAETVAAPPDTGSLEIDLRRMMRRTVGAAAAGDGRLLAALMAAAQLDDEFAASFRDGFLARRREVLRALLERARERGELAEGANIDVIVEVTFGTLWYRILGRHAPLNGRFAGQLAQTALTLARAERR